MKTILRDKANFDVLEGFLSALFDDEEIKILNILESETNKFGVNSKNKLILKKKTPIVNT